MTKDGAMIAKGYDDAIRFQGLRIKNKLHSSIWLDKELVYYNNISSSVSNRQEKSSNPYCSIVRGLPLRYQYTPNGPG